MRTLLVGEALHKKGVFGMNLLCGPPSNLCVSAFNGHFNAEAAKIRRAPQRKRIKFATLLMGASGFLMCKACG